MISILGILRYWTPRDYVATGSALATQARIEWRIRRRPLPSTAQAFGIPLLTGAGAATEPFIDRLSDQERHDLRAVGRVLRHWPWEDTCLRRALATGYVLRHRGPSLRVGVTKTEGEVRAHAWLEIDGRTLDPAAPTEFSSLIHPIVEGAG